MRSARGTKGWDSDNSLSQDKRWLVGPLRILSEFLAKCQFQRKKDPVRSRLSTNVQSRGETRMHVAPTGSRGPAEPRSHLGLSSVATCVCGARAVRNHPDTPKWRGIVRSGLIITKCDGIAVACGGLFRGLLK